jgi:hypothetical protein
VAREASFWPEHALRRALAVVATSVALSALTVLLLLTRHRFLAGLSALASSAALLGASVLARREVGRSERIGRRVHLAERLADLLFDASVLVPLAWVMRAGSNWDAVLALVGLGAAYLASYERAKGQALGYVGVESLGYRVTREALLVIGLLTGWVAGALWAFTIVALAAVGARAWNVAIQDRHSRAAQESPR